MDTKTTSIVAYITWIGLLIAFCAGDREGAKFHLNQALVIFLFGLLGWIPCIGWIWSITVLSLALKSDKEVVDHLFFLSAFYKLNYISYTYWRQISIKRYV